MNDEEREPTSEKTIVSPPEPDMMALLATCTRFVAYHGYQPPADLLAEIPADTRPDFYGDGGVVAELEAEVASLLGMPAAVFLPSGTMGQQATLRVLADRLGRRVVVFHPACHVAGPHEGGAYERLHRLIGRPAGDPHRLLTLADLTEVKEPAAVLLLELPQVDLGGQLPSWEDLQAQVAWARDGGAAVHLDGARLWECAPAYGRGLDEIAALFDTVYVSFYKKIGGLTGCCVAGPDDVIAEVREWRLRHGGTLFAMWPYAASNLIALRKRLPLMSVYHQHALAIADALRGLPGLEIVPDPPHTSMMNMLIRADPEVLRAAALKLAEEERLWAIGSWSLPTDSPHVQRIPFDVGDATLTFSPLEVRDVLQRIIQESGTS